MDYYPLAMYRMPGRDVETDSGWCAYRVVADDAEREAAMAEGWHETAPAALAATIETKTYSNGTTVTGPGPLPDDPPPDDAPPTRAELEQKAAELGIKFDGRWGDKRLADAIAAALKG